MARLEWIMFGHCRDGDVRKVICDRYVCERARVCVHNGIWPDYMQHYETILLSKGWSTPKILGFHNLHILMLIQTCMHLTISVEPTVQGHPLPSTIFNFNISKHINLWAYFL